MSTYLPPSDRSLRDQPADDAVTDMVVASHLRALIAPQAQTAQGFTLDRLLGGRRLLLGGVGPEPRGELETFARLFREAPP